MTAVTTEEVLPQMAQNKKPTKKPTKKVPKLSAKTRKALAGLDARKQMYVQGRLRGKSKAQAALDAGFSRNMAHAASREIEKPDVAEVIESAMEDFGITTELLMKRLREGLDAKVTKLESKDGVFTDSIDMIDFEQRGKYFDRAAKLKKLDGYKQAGLNIEAGDNSQIIVVNDMDY